VPQFVLRSLEAGVAFVLSFFSPKEKDILLMHATMIFGIDFEIQPTEGAFVWYY